MKDVSLKDDGLGYDEIKKQYFVVCYAWKYLDKVNNRSKYLIVKSGITKHNVNHAMKASTPTRGKMYQTTALWGFDSDRKYLPKGISKLNAAKIVNKMDIIFKDGMEDLGLVYKSQINASGIGTEFYRGDKNAILDKIKEEWDNALNSAQLIVLKKVKKTNTKQIQYRGQQWMHPIIIEEYLKENDLGRVIAPCGSGKTIRMFTDININSFFSSKKINVLFGPKIAATQQLCLRFSQYAEDTAFDGVWKSVVVCSDHKRNKEYDYYGIEFTSNSDSKIKSVLEQAFTSNEKFLFFVNQNSAGEFWNLYYKLMKKYKFNELPGVIYDEVHRYAGNKNNNNTQCVVKAKTDCMLSYTATPKYRGVNKDKDRIYNDDEKYFGKVALEIKPQEAIDQGLNSEIRFKLLEVWDNGDLGNEILKNKEIALKFKRKSVEVRGNLLRVIPALKSEINDKKTHIYIPTSRKQNVSDLLNLIELCQKYGYISKDYKLVRGLIDDGKKSFETFSKHKKAIIVSTRWSIESLDYPIIKSIIPMNNFTSEVDADQTIGRGQRPFNNEVLSVCIPFNPMDRNNTLLKVAHDKICNNNTIVRETKITKDIDATQISKVLGSKQNVGIKVELIKDNSTPTTIRVEIDKVISCIGTDVFGEVYKSWRAKRYTDEEIIKSAKPHKTPHQWRIADESIYFHAYYRRENDDIWDIATKHMEHRTNIDVDNRMKELFEAIEKCKDKVWAMKIFSKKYPKLQNWLKNNPKQAEPKIWNGKVVDMSILPFTAGKFGHITKQFLLDIKNKSENFTDWANNIGISYQALKGLCNKNKVEFEDMIIPIEIRARENGSKSKMIRTNKGQFLTAVKKKK